DRCIRFAGHQLGDKGSIYLQGVQLKALQVAQRRVARTEVVEGDRDPQRLELRENGFAARDVIHQERLGELQLEVLRVEIRVLEHFLDRGRQAFLPKLSAGKIYRNRYLLQSAAVPVVHLRACPAQHPFADGVDEA